MGLPPDVTSSDRDPQDAIQIANLQILLMEDVYFSLRLDHYANARDNRGWMNLFRHWGHSRTFRACFRQVEFSYSRDFVWFYYKYIENWGPIDAFPIPHAWDVVPWNSDGHAHPSAVECFKRGAPGLFQDPGRLQAREPTFTAMPVPAPPPPLPGQRGSTGLTSEREPPQPA